MTLAAAPSQLSASADLALAELIEQLTGRFVRGESFDVELFLAEHPTHADRLRPLIPALMTLAEISGSARGVAVSAARPDGFSLLDTRAGETPTLQLGDF